MVAAATAAAAAWQQQQQQQHDSKRVPTPSRSTDGVCCTPETLPDHTFHSSTASKSVDRCFWTNNNAPIGRWAGSKIGKYSVRSGFFSEKGKRRRRRNLIPYVAPTLRVFSNSRQVVFFLSLFIQASSPKVMIFQFLFFPTPPATQHMYSSQVARGIYLLF